MAPDEYSKALDKALADLQQGVQQRDLLNANIAGLRETVRVLSTLVKMPSDKQREVAKLLAMADYATPSLTDAIRSLLLRVSPKEMTAIEVRNELEDSSDTEGCSLSACHAALKRMLSDEEVEAGPTKNGKATYRRVLKLDRVPSYPMMTHNALADRVFYNRVIPSTPIDSDKLPDEVRRIVATEQAMREAVAPRNPRRRTVSPPPGLDELEQAPGLNAKPTTQVHKK